MAPERVALLDAVREVGARVHKDRQTAYVLLQRHAVEALGRVELEQVDLDLLVGIVLVNVDADVAGLLVELHLLHELVIDLLADRGLVDGGLLALARQVEREHPEVLVAAHGTAQQRHRRRQHALVVLDHDLELLGIDADHGVAECEGTRRGPDSSVGMDAVMRKSTAHEQEQQQPSRNEAEQQVRA